MEPFDRRLIPARKDLVADHLADSYEAPRSAKPILAKVSVAVADLRPLPEDVVADTQLLCGELVMVYDVDQGWAWVQATEDSYVGYLREDQIVFDDIQPPTHRVATLGSNIYQRPSLKTPTIGQLPFAAKVQAFEIHDHFVRIGEDQWVPEQHLVGIDDRATDWVAVAEMFVGVPYLWGGRSNLGLDCSALIQLARSAAGFRCLRDSDMQARSEGETLPEETQLERGDLLFWRGHVGVMSAPETLLHANGHHMAVAYEPIGEAISRIQRAEGNPVSRRARLA